MLAEPWIMSRFLDESNSAMTHPDPIHERERRGCGDHYELSTVHAGNESGAKKKGSRGDENSGGKAESIGARMFSA